MKKIFTLVAGMLLASSSAFAQAKWTSVINNGDLEGDDVTNFWAKDWPEGEERVEGPGRIIAEPGNESNHVLVVRIPAEGEYSYRYDGQFWITATEEIPANKMLRISMKIKTIGESAGHLGTQSHDINRSYKGYNTFGEFDVPNDAWYELSWEGECPEGVSSVCFDLWTDQNKGKEIIFDDIVMEIKDGIPPKELEGWFNVLKSGGKVGDPVYQYTWNLSGKIGRNTNPYFTVSGYQNDGKGTVPCEIVNDPIDGQPAYTLTTTVATEWRDTTINIDGTNKSPVPYFMRKAQEGSDSLEILKGYTTQLFVGGSHVFKKGEKYHFKMDMRATQATQASAQAHYSPGDYKHWQFLSGNIQPNEEWQTYEYEGEISSDQAGTTSIAFNLNEWNFAAPENDVAITYYFRNIEYCVNSAEILEADRVLAGDTVAWAAPAKSDDPTAGIEVKVDLTKAIEALGASSVADLLSGRFKVLAKDANEAAAPYEISELDYFIDGEGLYADDGINVFCDPDNVEGNVATFNLFNSAIETDAATNIATKIYFIKEEDAEPAAEHVKRYYDYELNINILGEEAMGVTTVKTQKADAAIYDLSGRRVAKATKGLYITDGKKILVK
jgi:hypothetical protein